MKKFKDLDIQQPERFQGEKLGIYDILNKEIIVRAFKIVKSKFVDKGSGLRLDLQIEIDNVENVTWTSSGIMIEQIKQLTESDFPFTTTIIKLNPKGFKFT